MAKLPSFFWQDEQGQFEHFHGWQVWIWRKGYYHQYADNPLSTWQRGYWQHGHWLNGHWQGGQLQRGHWRHGNWIADQQDVPPVNGQFEGYSVEGKIWQDGLQKQAGEILLGPPDIQIGYPPELNIYNPQQQQPDEQAQGGPGGLGTVEHWQHILGHY
jgi:hypothetical protein